MPELDKKLTPQPIGNQTSGLTTPKKRSIRKIILWISCVLIAVIIGVAASGIIWYNVNLTSVGNDSSLLKKITIDLNSTPAQIGKQLEDESIIRSATAFDIYLRLSGKRDILKAGTYLLSPAETTQQIVEHFVDGTVDTFNITFYPGATLIDKSDKQKKYDVTTALKNTGFYTDSEISAALSDTYESPLFVGKPAGTDLEGYIYGETYNFNVGVTVGDILQRTFDEFYAKIEDNNLIDSFSSHNLNLYQGITLASIVQREVNNPEDQKKAAQVFYSRLDLGMNLGSDVTYQYIADKTGVARDFNLDSPYNTRRYPGLPPGPIATPGLSALLAVAQPAEGDYLYFLSGDDGVTYFARTNAEHEANVLDHCKENCSTQ